MFSFKGTVISDDSDGFGTTPDRKPKKALKCTTAALYHRWTRRSCFCFTKMHVEYLICYFLQALQEFQAR